MPPRLVSVCRLTQLAEQRPQRVVAPDGTVLVCVRRGDGVDVLDDRCPHEGHPLSMGLVRDGAITCAWHNWKFSLETGDCTVGDEGTLRYPSAVHLGEVFVDLTPDRGPRIERAARDLHRALHRGVRDGAVRDALRLDALTHTPDRAFHECLAFAAARSPDGVTDALTVAHAARDLHEGNVLDAAERHATLASAVITACAGHPARPVPPPSPTSLDDVPGFLTELLDERRREAQARVLGLPGDVSADAIARAWLLPYASLKLWDLGAALPRVAALAALGPALPPAMGRALAGSLAVSLGASYAPSDLPAWNATRRALAQARALPVGDEPLRDPALLVSEALVSEGQAVHAALVAASEGAAPHAILDALADAACTRLARYVPLARGPVAATSLDAGRALEFIDAARALAVPGAPWGLAHAVLAAGFVGKLRRHDAEETHVAPRDGALDALRDALRRRDARDARAQLDGLPEAAHTEALREIVRFGALSSRGESAAGVPLAAALWRHGRAPSRTLAAARAGLRAFVEAPTPDLASLAAEARRVVAPRAVRAPRRSLKLGR